MYKDEFADLYAVAAARVVVTSKTSFLTACGDRTLAGEVMTVNRLPHVGDAGWEGVASGLNDRRSFPGNRDELSISVPETTVDDPEVLLAWLLADGLSTFH